MNDKTKKHQINVIKQASKALGSQAELARHLEIYPQHLSRYATGKREIPLSLYLNIVAVCQKKA